MNQRVQARPTLHKVAPILRLLNRAALVILREDVSGQGGHIDPLDPATEPPVTARWTTVHRRAFDSPTTDHFRDALRPVTGGTERDGVIGDLATYHSLGPEDVVARCLSWEQDSVAEWESASRDDAAGIADFYATVESWSFDLLWYAYLQSAGYGYPESVIAADYVGQQVSEPGRMLDLGSGAGVTAQLFAALDYDVTLADISAPLLEFAQWRLDERGIKATYLHLPTDLGENAFDLITALDVIAHIPDPEDTALRLHRALRPGGLLVLNYDVRRHSPENAWHLHEDDLPLRWAVERAGFRQVAQLDGVLWVYRATEQAGTAWGPRTILAWARLASPPARAMRAVRRALARAILVTVYALIRARRRTVRA